MMNGDVRARVCVCVCARARVCVCVSVTGQASVQIKKVTTFSLGTRWRSWLKHFAKSRKVTGSIQYVVTVTFN